MSGGKSTFLAQEYEYYTEQASTGLRAYIFAIIAANWLFLVGGSENPTNAIAALRVEGWLAASILLAVAALAADWGQYLFASIYIQRRQQVFEFMVRPGPWPTSDRDAKIMWGRAVKYRMLALGVTLAGRDTGELRSGPASNYIEVWRSSLNSDSDGSLVEALSGKVPMGLVRGTRRLFLIKTVLSAASFCSLLAYLVTKLLA